MLGVSRASQRLLKRIGARVRSLRRARGWSQEQLAFEADLDRASIGDIERGLHDIGVTRLAKIAAALKVKLTELLGDI
jgi:transcriptional regulator with XRE-family HTH domain